ncbi:MAG TPA: hypothetical protein VFE10_13190, partial [Phenylobacterium sp.]|nr:hypothetical protein [Phenylobacterium sp.]
MKRFLRSSAAVALSIVAMTALPTTAAQAAVYISQLEYRDGLVGAQAPAYGTVTITELNPDSVRVEVDFTNAN